MPRAKLGNANELKSPNPGRNASAVPGHAGLRICLDAPRVNVTFDTDAHGGGHGCCSFLRGKQRVRVRSERVVIDAVVEFHAGLHMVSMTFF